MRVDDGLVFADIVLGDDVFEDRLSRRTASLFQTSDGRSDHFGVLWVSSRYFRLSCLLGGLGGDGRHLGNDCGATIERTDKRRKRTEYEKTALGSRLYTERADVVVDQPRLVIERLPFVAVNRSAVLLSHQNSFHVAI